MENRVLGIVGANIHGLDEKPYYFDHRVCFAWDITFSRCPYLGVKNLTPILLAKTEEEALEIWESIREQFSKLSIKDGSRVLILYDEATGEVIGITNLNAEKWLNVHKNFTPKFFMHLIANYDKAIVRR